MACCGADYTFTWVDVGDYGWKNDASIFSNLVFGKMIIKNNAIFLEKQRLPGTDVVTLCVFVTDTAFPLKECIMKLFPGHDLPVEQTIFNYRLTRARRTIKIHLRYSLHIGKYITKHYLEHPAL
ncbi:hypothetical protein PR048_020795 [Dryococelus australis]|uniref:DDE Tnp4 domain-containing protein n=1 Tax=Dryococelus australis TaxID=614101 RepID=A0ABQ9GWE7_9NEOP|nr:hypothetical protein PR048_020795 [Dryococelus australis]